MEDRLNVCFDILAGKRAKITMHMLKHMVLCSSSNSVINIIDAEQVGSDRRHTVEAVQASSKQPV